MDPFRPISVERILEGSDIGYKDGKVEFWIPSFQRGYRWEPQQVIDLLDDLYNFAASGEIVYFMQPLVVRPHKCDDGTVKGWDVLDGQQRLTTIYLILNSRHMQESLSGRLANWVENHIYSINYCTSDRNIDWNNLDSLEKMDYYYLLRAWNAIDKWFGEKNENDSTVEEMCKALCADTGKGGKHVDFIWYEVDAKESKDLASIAIFNRLNKGQIKLTSSELIKALFVLCKNRPNDTIPFATDWDIKEKRFQDDAFWYFLNSQANEVQTRMDLLFDVTYERYKAEGKTNQTSAYRFFQEEYDKSPDDKVDFAKLWDVTDGYYNELLQWYEDTTMYNYVGYLIHTGKKISDIQRRMSERRKMNESENLEWDTDMTYQVLKDMISESVKNCELSELQYDSDNGMIRKILLLFNILSYNTSDQRFPFDKYVNESWDIEHVDSQSGSKSLQATDDKKSWLSFVIKGLTVYHAADNEIDDLIKEACKIRQTLEETGKDEGKSFEDFYDKIIKFQSKGNGNQPTDSTDDDKQGLGNLTLLDCQTNRGYKDAPYPYKRYCIISRDKAGGFVPLCTKNLFLKYYSDDDRMASQMDIIRWHHEDKVSYFAAIEKVLDPFINPIK